jgi:hypothetical protein
MCKKCAEIDIVIERYKHVVRSISDELTVDSAKDLISDLKAQKAALHSEQVAPTPQSFGP